MPWPPQTSQRPPPLSAADVEAEGAGGRGRAARRRAVLAKRARSSSIAFRYVAGLRARRAAERRLVDEHDVGERVEPLDGVAGADLVARQPARAQGVAVQHVDEQRRLARAADAGEAREAPDGQRHVDAAQVVRARAADRQPRRRRVAQDGPRRHRRRRAALARAQELRGDAVAIAHERVVAAGEHDLAAARAGAGAEVDDRVGLAHDVGVVLDDDDGVAARDQLLEHADEPVRVARVQAHRRLVEHVERAGQVGAERRRRARCAAPRRPRACAPGG